MVSMETKEEKKSPLRLFIPPRPFFHSHWESGYEGYVIEGKPCSNEEFEMHRMYQYASPFTVLEFKANSICVLYDKDEQHLFSIEDVCSLFPLLQRGWPLSMLVKTLSLPSKEEWKEDTTVELNICYPALSSQKPFDIDDENKLRVFMDKRISQEVEGDCLGDEFKGYIFR
ncbi:hypothetical protein BLSTO_04572 [Blastocystis sp. subtype 1]